MGHTPAPWRVHPGQRNLVIGNGHDIALVKYWMGSEDIAEVNANARLIAAAPDLLEALEFLLQPLTLGEGDAHKALDHLHKSVELAQAAIAKARGEA